MATDGSKLEFVAMYDKWAVPVNLMDATEDELRSFRNARQRRKENDRQRYLSKRIDGDSQAKDFKEDFNFVFVRLAHRECREHTG